MGASAGAADVEATAIDVAAGMADAVALAAGTTDDKFIFIEWTVLADATEMHEDFYIVTFIHHNRFVGYFHQLV